MELFHLPINLRVDGTAHRVDVDPRTTLLDLLRERLGVTDVSTPCNGREPGTGVRVRDLPITVDHFVS